MSAEPMSYIARCKCGAIVMATVDKPEHAKDTAREVAECIADGLTIERVTCQCVRDNWSDCTCEQADPQLALDLLT